MANPDAEIEAADEAFLSFGGWAKAMPNPPGLNDRRRYVVDVQCTAAGIKTSDKGDRHTRTLSIIRVKEIVDAEVPPADVDENQAALFDEGEPAAADDDNVTDIATARSE